MTLFGTLALVCWAGFFACVLSGFTIEYKIVEAVNRKRPGQEPFHLFDHRMRGFAANNVWRLYRAYFPEGKLIRNYWLTTIGGFVCLALAFVCLVNASDHAVR